MDLIDDLVTLLVLFLQFPYQWFQRHLLARLEAVAGVPRVCYQPEHDAATSRYTEYLYELHLGDWVDSYILGLCYNTGS